MKLTSIASGSSGNCIFVGSDQGNLLVDAGISAKKIEQGLKELNVQPADLDEAIREYNRRNRRFGGV